MNAIIALYTRTDGRIARKSWWLGLLGLFVVSLILTWLLSLVGLGVIASGTQVWTSDAGAVATVSSSSIHATAWGSVVLFILLAYPAYCLSIKRRQDRDNSGLDLKIYMGLLLLLTVVQALGLGMSTAEINGVTVPVPAGWLVAVSFVLGIFALYMLVVLGFLRGTVGDNSFGPNPAGGSWTPAT